MATRQFGVWGIDLGQCALKAIRLEMKDGHVVATAFEYIEHPKILSQPDADPDELIREALTQFLSRNAIRGDFIAISVPGQSGLARFVKLPPVNQSKIADIVKFEAKQQIPFPLDEVVWDFQPLSTGEVVDGMALETEIGLFAMKRDMVNRAIHQFKDVNVEVHLVQMAPLALCNFISYDLLGKDTGSAATEEDDHACVVALEIGTDSSNLVITDGGRIIWQRPIPIGGNHFTRALTKEMKLTFAKAEHLKRNAAKSPELKKILSSLKQVLNDFVGEVQRSLGYFTNTHRNAQIQYMIGLGNAFRLPGLQKFLQEKLQLEVRKLTGLERTTGESVTGAPTFSENIMSFAVAYGLALQGLKQAKLQTNLLPYEVRLERLVRGKKPWAVTAAASLLVGLFLLAFARGVEKEAVTNNEIKKGVDNLAKVVRDAEQHKSLQKQAAEKAAKSLAVLARIGAGVDQRLNWQLLMEYINFAMPQPNGDHLVEVGHLQQVVKGDLWDKNAKKAYVEWELEKFRKDEPQNPEKAREKELFIKKHLLQINIIGINALYSEDLGPYYRKIYKDGDNLLGMSPSDKEKLVKFAIEDNPDKAKTLPLMQEAKEGWVVEIRGYTYHEKKNVFIENTLIENLKFPDRLKDLNGKDIVLPPELKTQVMERVGFLTLYLVKNVQNPVAGKFEYVGGSYLSNLIKGSEGKGGVGGIGGGIGGKAPLAGGPQGGAVGAEKPSRDGWKAIGEANKGSGGVAGGAPGLGGRPGGNPPPGAGGLPNADSQISIPRTEFVLLFVWREPLPGQLPAPLANQDKKN